MQRVERALVVCCSMTKAVSVDGIQIVALRSRSIGVGIQSLELLLHVMSGAGVRYKKKISAVVRAFCRFLKAVSYAFPNGSVRNNDRANVLVGQALCL